MGRWEHVSALRKVTKESLLRLFDNHISKGAENRRCLVSRTYSQEAADAKAAEDASGAASNEGRETAVVPVLDGLEDVRAFKSQLPIKGQARVNRESFWT
eukprot:scaffold1541_cov256-Pinguiococcus_pyrenoidosus.AAC.16